MATMTFQINDASTSDNYPAVWVTLTEGPAGTLGFSITQEGGIIGDLRGLFFDVADESILSSLRVTAASPDIRLGNDSIKDLGDGANMNGLLGSDKGYDVGIEIGSAGIGRDDIQSYQFTLASTARDLSLADFAHVDFAARLTSVGEWAGARADSAKLLESTSAAIRLNSVAASVVENAQASGNLLEGVNLAGGTVVTAWSGGEVGTELDLVSQGSVIGNLQINADGRYEVDASAADVLSAGEEIVFTVDYTARNQSEATAWSTDNAQLTVTLVGRNDGPEAGDDAAGTVREDAVLQGSVSRNDSDVDRLDSHTWTLVDGSFSGLGELVMSTDGTWSFAAQGAYADLNAGEQVDLSFQYVMTDNHGATDLASVSFSVVGVGAAVPPALAGGNDFPTWQQDISNITLIFDQTAGDVKPNAASDGAYTVKINVGGDFNDDLDMSITAILAALDAVDPHLSSSADLLGVVIKGGLQTTQYYAYAEHNLNDAAADLLPDSLGFVLPGDHGNVDPTNAIDAVYDYGSLMFY